MTVSDKLKAAIKLQGQKQTEIAAALGIRYQALGNKFVRQSFTSKDLIVIAEALGLRLALVDQDGTPVITFTADDLPKDEQQETAHTTE